ncbi:hypothetical protein HDV00_001557 [Rhizophlyctis rosea]|nr:hypothetical protein HDV00_001557 [Rhizophlyctis rosea]
MWQAATNIQRVFRGHRIRLRFGDLKVNEIVHAKTPDLYWTEKIIKDAIEKEMIPDLLVELSASVYSPVCCTPTPIASLKPPDSIDMMTFDQLWRTKEMRAYRMRYDLLEDVISQCIREDMADIAAVAGDGQLVCQLDPYSTTLQSIVDEVLEDMLRDVVKSAIQDAVNVHMANIQADRIYGILLSEVVEEMQLTREASIDVLQAAVLDDLLDDVMAEEAGEMFPRLALEMKISIGPSAKQYPQSHTIDAIMDLLFDDMVMEHLLMGVVRDDETALVDETIEQLADGIVLEDLLGRMLAPASKGSGTND